MRANFRKRRPKSLRSRLTQSVLEAKEKLKK
jgi:hypothetical protein